MNDNEEIKEEVGEKEITPEEPEVILDPGFRRSIDVAYKTGTPPGLSTFPGGVFV